MIESFLSDFFASEQIEYYASCELSRLCVIQPRRLPSWAKGAVVFLIPYRLSSPAGNLSCYAVPRDYHGYIREFSGRLESFALQKGCTQPFFCAADTSPIAEQDAALKLGLGFLGNNHLLINESYGSFVFIGAVFTSRVLTLRGGEKTARTGCIGCGKCLSACPGGCLSSGDFSRCLSALTQKKKLTAEEEIRVARHRLIWGCDICQEVCPHNRQVKETPIPYFQTQRMASLTAETLEAMSDEDFAQRAYSWRGREVLRRNLRLKDADRTSITETDEKINTTEIV